MSLEGYSGSTRLVLLIDKMLHEAEGYVSIRDIISEGNRVGIALPTDNKYSLKSSRVRVSQAIKELRKELAAKDFNLLERQNDEDRRCVEIAYPAEVKNGGIDIFSNYKPAIKKLTHNRIDELLDMSEGVLPDALLAKALSRQRQKRGERVIIQTESNDALTNLSLLPEIFIHIKNRHVIAFNYKPIGKPMRHVLLHAHLLKEYNSRWFVIGKAVQDDGAFDHNNYALDRIVGDICERPDIEYIEPEEDMLDKFRAIVGVSIPPRVERQHITIRTNDAYTHSRIQSKPIHRSQRELAPFDGEKGRFELDLIPNLEFRGVILSFGRHVVVEAPEWLSREIAKELGDALAGYGG